MTVFGTGRNASESISSRASVSISTSSDEVGAPIFYREVNLPFRDAVKDPSRIRWRFGEISSAEQPPIVLENLPVCGNCHSFSSDGKILGMDVDYANDRGSYAIAPVAKQIVLDDEKIITWSDYKRDDEELTFGLLSRVSPDGRYVASMVKDRSVFVAKDDLAYSQLFFPIKGILVVYDRQSKQFRALPGADDPAFVQSNPAWSPDGKYLVFARSEAYHLKNLRNEASALLTAEECREFLEDGRTFQFDLYRIPFNGGKGGKPEPLEGASHNGMSNYFPKFSPDGKWIVFCRAKSFMLLQPDSELYIIPSQGGQARRLECNTARMNSWHSWSPNGKWLVFSSKAYSPYTQLFLAHIDERGRSSVPVVLSRFTSPDRAANIPEFVNAERDAIRRISEAFVDDYNYYRAAGEYIKDGDLDKAAPLLRKALEANPDNVKARLGLANILSREGNRAEAKLHLRKILERDPDHVEANHSFAVEFHREGKFQDAAEHCRRALAADANHYASHSTLGLILLDSGKADQAIESLQEALRLDPDDPFANYICGHAMHRRNLLKEAADYYQAAVRCDPDYVSALLGLASIRIIDSQPELFDAAEAVDLAKRACDATGRKDPAALEILAGAYLAAGRFGDALTTARATLDAAYATGNQDLIHRSRKTLELYDKAIGSR